MSNIWVGGISFGSGFSSGFQRAGLEPLLFEINPQTVQTAISIDVVAGSSTVLLEQFDAYATTGEIIVQVYSSNLIVHPNTPTLSLGCATSANLSNVIITPWAPAYSIGINVPTTSSNVVLNQYGVSVDASANATTNESVVVLNAFDISLNIGASCIADTATILLNLYESTAKGNSNTTLSESTVTLNLQNVTTSQGTSVDITSSAIAMTLEPVSVVGNTNTSVEKSDIIITLIDPCVQECSVIYADYSVITMTLYGIFSETAVHTSACNIILSADYEVEAGYILPNWNDCGELDNPFWDKSSTCRDAESKLFGCMTVEAFNKFGVPAIWYQVDYATSNERILGEDNDRTILRNFAVQYYTENLPADDKIWSKWGIEGMDRFHVYVAKDHFATASQYDLYGNFVESSQRPKPGDIIKSTHNNVYYDVIEVKDRIEMFMQRSHTWDITLRPMIDAHYSISDDLMGDDIVNHINVNDILSTNDIINIQKDSVLYKSNPSIDPFGLL